MKTDHGKVILFIIGGFLAFMVWAVMVHGDKALKGPAQVAEGLSAS